MTDLTVAQQLAVGPLAGATVFVALTGGRLPRARPRLPRRALTLRWLGLGAQAGVEEVVWRGIVLVGLAAITGPIVALACSSAGFAVWHAAPAGRRCFVHLLTGATFGAAFLIGGILVAALAHAVYNVLVDWAVHAERARLRGP